MNSVIRPYPITENPSSVWTNKIAKSVNANNIYAGQGIDITYTSNGSIISLASDINNNRLIWKGDYSFNAEYLPGDVVRVNPNNIYTDENGAIIPVDSTDTAGHTAGQPPISPGLFVCKNYVPPSWCTSDFVTSEIISQFQNLPDRYVEGARFYNYNAYYPIYPEIPSHYTQSVAVYDGTYHITANNTFWQAMPFGGFTTKICQDGVTNTFWVIGAKSGSVFLPAYLPFSG